jgi:hypothetical protein
VARVRPRTPPEYVGRRVVSLRSRRFGCNASTSSASSSWAAAVHVAGCTPNPNAPWVIQQARQLSSTLAERSEPMRFLIRDRDQKFTDRFDDVFRSEGIEIVRTPFRAPQANGVAERFVRTVRSECFDCLLILTQQHLERVLQTFIEHYNGHRPHRALSLTPPEARRSTPTPLPSGDAHILRRDRLGGVVHEYLRAASTRISAPYTPTAGLFYMKATPGEQRIWRSCRLAQPLMKPAPPDWHLGTEYFAARRAPQWRIRTAVGCRIFRNSGAGANVYSMAK